MMNERLRVAYEVAVSLAQDTQHMPPIPTADLSIAAEVASDVSGMDKDELMHAAGVHDLKHGIRYLDGDSITSYLDSTQHLSNFNPQLLPQVDAIQQMRGAVV